MLCKLGWASLLLLMACCLSDKPVSMVSPKYLMESDLVISQPSPSAEDVSHLPICLFSEENKFCFFRVNMKPIHIIVHFCMMSSSLLNANIQASPSFLLLGSKAACAD